MRGGVGAGGVGGMIIRLVGWGGGLIGWVGRADCLGWVSDDLSFDGSKKDTLAGYKGMVFIFFQLFLLFSGFRSVRGTSTIMKVMNFHDDLL